MTSVMRRVQAFKKGRHENPAFPWWDTALLDAGHGTMMQLDVISGADMDKILSDRKRASVVAIPVCISLDDAGTTVRVYPAPARDYDAVKVEL